MLFRSNLDNFIITGVRTGSANAKTYTNDVTDAVWFGTSRSNIVLTLAQPAEHGSNFVLRVTGIQDIAGNTLADGVVQVASVDRQLAIDGTDNNYWAYWDSMSTIIGNPDIPPDDVAHFMDPDYDDVGNGWSAGASTFVNEDTRPLIGSTDIGNTTLGIFDGSRQNSQTTYFRNWFLFPGSMTNSPEVRIRHWVDDGIALYVNGKLSYTYNMPNPTNKYTYTTRATSSVEGSLLPATSRAFNYFTVAITNVQPGSNSIAVELHQNGSDDAAFGLELWTKFMTYLNGSIKIGKQPENVTVAEGGSATFTVAIAEGEPDYTYLWKSATASGSTFTNIYSPSTASGTNRATLSLSNIPFSANGAKFQ